MEIIRSNTIQCVFFGEDGFSVDVLRSIIDSKLNVKILTAVSLIDGSRASKKFKLFCKSRGIEIIQIVSTQDEDFIDLMLQYDYDFLISAHFKRLIPLKIVEKARIASLNLHPSLLPKYKGMSPQHWPLILGECKTGVTVHHMMEEADTGDIIIQREININENMYVHELHQAFIPVYKQIMVEAIYMVLNGHKGKPQKEGSGSYYPKICNEDMDLKRQLSVFDAYGRIRAFSFPYAGAFYKEYRIMEASILSDTEFLSFCNISSNDQIVFRGTRMYLLFKNGGLAVTRWMKKS